MEPSKGGLTNIIGFLLLLAGLQAVAAYRGSLFHVMVELLCVFAAFAIFTIAWNAKDYYRNNHLLYIEIAFLFVGTIDLLHILTAQDMAFFSGGLNLSVQLWLVARYLQAVSILLGIVFYTKIRIKPGWILLCYSVATGAVLSWIFVLKTFPACFLPGTGITRFKTIGHYIVLSFNVLSLVLLCFKRKKFEGELWRYLSFALLATVLSDLAFLQTTGLSSLYGTAGQYLKLLSCYFFYKTIVKTVLIKPYDSLRQQEDALQNEKERLAITLRSIGDGVIATDLEGKIILLNRMGEKITGWQQSEAVGKTLDDVFYLIDDKTSEPYTNITKRVLKTQKPFELERNAVLVTKDLFEREVTVSCSPIQNAKGINTGVVLVFRDVTDKRRMEKEHMNALKLESLGILAEGIAHDFNNILAGMLTNIQLAQIMSKEGKDIQGHLNDLEAALNKAAALTRQLMTFSKGGAPVKTSASIFELVRETAEFTLCGSNILCEYVVDDDLWAVEIDKDQISQVINNLVINAKQAMPNGGILTIQGENVALEPNEKASLPAGKYVKISVTDQGVGIPKDHLDRIFDPYFTTKPDGNGLGLSMSYSIIREHNGYIEVESEVGIGSTFSIYLPATEGAKHSEGMAGVRLEGQGRILLMDDNEAIRLTTKQILDHVGYEVELAKNGQEVIELYRRALLSGKPFAAVVVDLTIPGGMGGMETFRVLQQIDPSARAIISTGYCNDLILSKYREAGFQGIISKPYKVEDLVVVLHKVINQEGQGSQKVASAERSCQ